MLAWPPARRYKRTRLEHAGAAIVPLPGGPFMAGDSSRSPHKHAWQQVVQGGKQSGGKQPWQDDKPPPAKPASPERTWRIKLLLALGAVGVVAALVVGIIVLIIWPKPFILVVI